MKVMKLIMVNPYIFLDLQDPLQGLYISLKSMWAIFGSHVLYEIFCYLVFRNKFISFAHNQKSYIYYHSPTQMVDIKPTVIKQL